MTDAEMRLWFRLRPMRVQGLAFRRQSPIGKYIVDFEWRKAKLCVEVDGSQHTTTDALACDAERSAWLERKGYLVLRYPNHDVLHRTDAVIEEILYSARGRVSATEQEWLVLSQRGEGVGARARD